MKKFRKIYVEITNVCNMNCSFCPKTTRAKAFMSEDNFEHIAKEIVMYTDYVYLHVKGEPLLHPRLKEILEVCNKYGLKINISTNAVLLKEKFQVIKNCRIRQLNISLHSFEKETNISLEDYLNTTFALCDILSNDGVIIRYKLWNDKKGNYNEYIIKKIGERYNLNVNENVLDRDLKLSNNIFLSIKEPFNWPDLNSKVENNNKCHALKHQIAILVDGTVVPCCVDNNGDIPLGNIFSENLEYILNSKKAKNIRKGFEDNKCIQELCKKCEYKTYVT